MIAKAVQLENVLYVSEFIPKILLLKFFNTHCSFPYLYFCSEKMKITILLITCTGFLNFTSKYNIYIYIYINI